MNNSSGRTASAIQNPRAPRTMDFNAYDWWGMDYEKFRKEIDGMLEKGWTVLYTKPSKINRITLFTLAPPEKVEEEPS